MHVLFATHACTLDGSDTRGKFLVQLPVVVAVARQIEVECAKSWVRKLTADQQSNASFSERSPRGGGDARPVYGAAAVLH
jgi:hypothetical protein